MTAENTIRPEFQKFAGKLVNIAELDALVKAEDKGFKETIKAALMYPVTLFRGLVNSFKTPPDLESAQFYITKEADAVYQAAFPTGERIPGAKGMPGRDAAYFEVSNVLNIVYSFGGPGALTKSFMKAIEEAPDHASEFAKDTLVKSGYGIGIDLTKPKPSLSAVPLSSSTLKSSSVLVVKRG